MPDDPVEEPHIPSSPESIEVEHGFKLASYSDTELFEVTASRHSASLQICMTDNGLYWRHRGNHWLLVKMAEELIADLRSQVRPK